MHLCAILIAAILITLAAIHARRLKMNEKMLDVITAVAIGIGLAILLVAWWSS
jgi:multisubunit Na+/H+ antiporter MnhB subunit